MHKEETKKPARGGSVKDNLKAYNSARRAKWDAVSDMREAEHYIVENLINENRGDLLKPDMARIKREYID